MRNLLSQSKDMSHEYCATVVQLSELTPIEGTDFLATVLVEGREIVVRKDRVKEGDVMIYVSNECQLDQLFLHYNNEFQDEELNANYSGVQKHVEQMKVNGASEDDIKSYIITNRGYFDKKCRVRMKRIKGVMSMGYLISPHTSSGRVPTDMGYRFYVNELMNSYDMAMADAVKLRRLFSAGILQLDRLIRQASVLRRMQKAL
jgi:transcriptional regulator of heat shock response